RWVRVAQSPQAARWRLTNFIRHAREKVGLGPLLAPVLSALETVEKHQARILQRWASTFSNARMEALNGIFQAARARARGYRNVQTFITMIYLIAAPIDLIIKST
ncbi:MAG: transposase, partial [Alphaproteobacteria bacterium]|nr:transposase [Alphaproteobacteria bacterium]